MSQMCCDTPPSELSAGLACRDNGEANASVEHLDVLDCVCAICKLHTHASIDNGKGIFLTLSQSEPRYKVPLEIETLGMFSTGLWCLPHSNDFDGYL